MWIKTNTGDLFNTDHMERIFTGTTYDGLPMIGYRSHNHVYGLDEFATENDAETVLDNIFDAIGAGQPMLEIE